MSLQVPEHGQRWIRRVSVAGHAETIRAVTTTTSGRVIVAVQGRAGTMDLDAFHAAYAWAGPDLVFAEPE